MHREEIDPLSHTSALTLSGNKYRYYLYFWKHSEVINSFALPHSYSSLRVSVRLPLISFQKMSLCVA